MPFFYELIIVLYRTYVYLMLLQFYYFSSQYTEGEKSFILEIKWGPSYPTEKPECNLEIFYNQHL